MSNEDKKKELTPAQKEIVKTILPDTSIHYPVDQLKKPRVDSAEAENKENINL